MPQFPSSRGRRLFDSAPVLLLSDRRSGWTTGLIVTCIALMLLSVHTKGTAGPHKHCDPELRAAQAANDLAYHERNDRCEGVYQPNVSRRLSLLSATLGSTPHGMLAKPSVDLWISAAGSDRVLSVTSTRFGAPYRMDHRFTEPAALFRWPLQLLSARIATSELPPLQVSDLAFLARGRLTEGAFQGRDVILPVRFAGKADSQAYRLQLSATADLRQVFTNLFAYDSGGERSQIWESRREKGQLYRKGQPFEVVIPCAIVKGEYLQLEVTGVGDGILNMVVFLKRA